MSDYFGSFGKMPSVGDFFRIHPPPGFVNVWDAWIQSAMVTGAEFLRERWDESYMSAPIWRFTLSPGLAGEGKVMGVLMPSVDRVGRRFPLTLTARLDTGGPVARDHFRQGPLFEKMEQTALSALDDDMTRDRLEQALSALPPPAAPVPILVRRGGDGPCFFLSSSLFMIVDCFRPGASPPPCLICFAASSAVIIRRPPSFSAYVIKNAATPIAERPTPARQ